jgi:putative phosphoesterase
VRIAVIGDSHNRVPPALLGLLREADEIWHLGDVCSPYLIDEINDTGCPFRVVRGNGDFEYTWPLSLLLDRGGVRFHLTHIPPMSAPAGCDVVLHGHTHVPRDERIDGVRWLNPGSVSWPRGGSAAGFAWLSAEGGKITVWEQVAL